MNSELCFRSQVFQFNKDKIPFPMSLSNSLTVVIENSYEEVERYLGTKIPSNPNGQVKLEPTHLSVSLHNPKEPADIRSKSFKIPLGHSTIVYITPQAREIDESGMDLAESQRNCRLDTDTDTLNIFNIYTRSACLLECKLKVAMKKCGCLPWNYPHNITEEVMQIS